MSMTPAEYNQFIKGALAVGFTDDQAYFLQWWFEHSTEALQAITPSEEK